MIGDDFNGCQFAGVFGTTTPTLIGMTALTTAGCTVTARTHSTTAVPLKIPRVGYVGSGTGAGSILTIRTTTTSLQSSLEAPYRDGFLWRCRFGISDAAEIVNARMFLGITLSTTALTNVSPATLTQCIGIGHESGTGGQLQIYGGDAAAGTPVNLGANFTCRYGNQNYFDLTLASDPDFGNKVFWSVVKDSTFRKGGQFEKAPANAQVLNPFNCFRTNGASTGAVSLDIMNIKYDKFT